MDASASPADSGRPIHRMRFVMRKIGWLWAVGAALVVGAEVFARAWLGLGDPPLSIRDPEIEYLFAPSRCYERFHHRVCYNRWSMRAPDFTPVRAGCERRVMVLGDSIVNGGSLLDQPDIATDVLRRKLNESGIRTIVGNISAGSWGPANVNAYTRRFGWFDADLAIFVFNSDDIDDVPQFVPELGPEFPLQTPLFALQEVVERYVPRALESLRSRLSGAANVVHEPVVPEVQAHGVAALRALLEEARERVPRRVVLLHSKASELGKPIPHREIFARMSAETGAEFMSMQTVENASYYLDDIHMNAQGQATIARVMTSIVERQLPLCVSAR